MAKTQTRSSIKKTPARKSAPARKSGVRSVVSSKLSSRKGMSGKTGIASVAPRAKRLVSRVKRAAAQAVSRKSA